MLRNEHDEARDVVRGRVVLVRVWADGLTWGAVCGMVYALLVLAAGVTWSITSDLPDVTEIGAALAFAMFVALFLGAPVGLVVGAVVAPFAALVLLAWRSLTDAAPTIATVITSVSLFLVLGLCLDGTTGEAVPFASSICIVAAWPMHRSLRRALLPAGRPA